MVVACLHSHSKVADAAAAAVAVPTVALTPLDAATTVVGSRDSLEGLFDRQRQGQADMMEERVEIWGHTAGKTTVVKAAAEPAVEA